VFVDGTDPRVWADAAARLLDERVACPDAWSARCDAARTRAGRFSWFLYAEQMAALYAQVAAGELAPQTGVGAREP
jgi:hypothetical protein